VLLNGEQTFPAIWKELRGAKQTITMQMYYSEPGKIADTLSAILQERARAGVSVHLLMDAFGSQNITKGYLDTLKAAGVHTAKVRPVHWYEMQKLQNRSHDRVVVVDGRVGFTGGFGIADKWLGNGHSTDQWRDTDVRFTGPAVSQLQATFADGWVEATGVLLTGEKYFPKEPMKEEPAEMAGLLDAQPTIGSTPAERFLALSIAGARQRLFITNSYFVPNHDFKQLLIQASKRGVDVRILTVGPKSDVKITRYAGRKQYDDLLTGGVRIFEFAPTMMHAKSLVADGLWVSVGSMNFDNRSMVFNNESNLNVLDAGTGAMLDSVFLDDLKYSKEITRAEFEKRGLLQRIFEVGASAMARLL
jgi:cardiolipin synthase